MRKLLSVIIIGVMVFSTCAVAFATGSDLTSENQGKRTQATVEKMKQVRTEANNGLENKTTPAGIKFKLTEKQRLELNELKITIKENHVLLVDLKKQILRDLQAIKAATAKPETDEYDTKQITNMKTILAELQFVRKEINVNLHPGLLMQRSKEVRMQKDFTSMRDALLRIIDEQDTRIGTLTIIEGKLSAKID